MREVWAVVVARTGTNAKTRLGPALDVEARVALAEAMLADVLGATREADLRGIVTVLEPAQDRTTGLVAVADPGSGHVAAVHAGVQAAMSEGAEAVVVLPGDLPLLRAEDVMTLVEAAAASPSVVVAPDRAGTGTNALVLRPPDAIAPAFGDGSLALHLAAARAAGVVALRIELERVALDIDTAADVAELRRRGPRGATRIALDRSHH